MSTARDTALRALNLAGRAGDNAYSEYIIDPSPGTFRAAVCAAMDSTDAHTRYYAACTHEEATCDPDSDASFDARIATHNARINNPSADAIIARRAADIDWATAKRANWGDTLDDTLFDDSPSNSKNNCHRCGGHNPNEGICCCIDDVASEEADDYAHTRADPPILQRDECPFCGSHPPVGIVCHCLAVVARNDADCDPVVVACRAAADAAYLAALARAAEHA